MICGLVVSTSSATCRSGTIRICAVRAALVGGQVEVAEVRREPAAVLRQLHVHLVVLAVGAEPVADRVAGEQRPDRRADLLHGDAEVGCGVVVETNRQRRIRGLVRRLEIDDARHLRDFVGEFLGNLRQRFGIGAEQVEPDRPVVADRELDAGHWLERFADQSLELRLRPRALAAVDELQVDARIVAAVLGAHGRHREVDLGELS